MKDLNNQKYELNPVSHITTDAIGPPGKRVFYLQGIKDSQTVTLILEKFQLQTLTIGIDQFLAEVRARIPLLRQASGEYDEDQMHIFPPVEPLFRVAEFGLSFDAEKDMVGIFAREIPAPPDDSDEPAEGIEVKLWCTRDQAQALVNWGIEVVSRGRPLCEQCGEPIDPEGHFCPRKNGHKH